jgi:hypothetical protein
LAPSLILTAGVVLILDGLISPRFVSTVDWPRLGIIWSITQISWVCLLVVWFLRRGSQHGGTVVSVVLVAIVSSVLIVWATPDPAIDVVRAHEQATAALLEGGNPYTDIAVQQDYVPEMVLRGYVYPPVPLLSFTVPAAVGLDVRYSTALAWALALAILGTAALRSSDQTPSVGVLILLAAQPGWLGILILGWTEPLAVLWITAGLLWVKRRPFLGAVALGLAFASKQYYLAVLPLFFTMTWPYRWRRAGIMILVALATVLPFALRSPNGFMDATIGNLADLPIRTDTANLLGLLDSLGIELTFSKWMAPIIGGAVAAFLGRKARRTRQVSIGIGITLGVVFVLGTQALESYWFLVLWILALAAISNDSSTTFEPPRYRATHVSAR